MKEETQSNGIGKQLLDYVKKIDIRNLTISPCKGCYGCAKTGVCVQKDDMASVLAELHECDGSSVEKMKNHVQLIVDPPSIPIKI